MTHSNQNWMEDNMYKDDDYVEASPLSLEPKGKFFMAETVSKELNKMFHVVVQSFYKPKVEPSNNVVLDV